MTIVVFDGTFMGWLTAVFDIYEYKFREVFVVREELCAPGLFSSQHKVWTDDHKAGRVLRGLEQRLSPEGVQGIYRTFLSEIHQCDHIMWKFVQHVFSSPVNVEGDLANSDVRDVIKAAQLVRRETHRMKAFVRFQLTRDGIYYAFIEPACNVLPLIAAHFKARYADQRWLIYDGSRNYGIFYDLEEVTTVELRFDEGTTATGHSLEIFDEREIFFQKLWRQYFKSVNIEARKNTKLHMQHMPKRYWRNLTEKWLEV